MEDQYYDIERRTAIKEEARLFRRKFLTYEQAEVLMSVHILFWIDILKESLEKCRNE